MKPTVIIELYGIPRARVGRSELVVQAATVQEALAGIVAACPKLADLCRADGSLAGHYLLSRDGMSFTVGRADPLKEGERLLLLSADAGG